MLSGPSKKETRRISFAIVHLQSRRFPTRLACGVVTAEPAVPKAAVVLAPELSDFDRSTDEPSWVPYPYPPYSTPQTKADNSMEIGFVRLRRAVEPLIELSVILENILSSVMIYYVVTCGKSLT